MLCSLSRQLSGVRFHTARQAAGMFMGAIPRGFIKDGLQKVKACGAREEEEEATGEKGEDLEHFRQRKWTKPEGLLSGCL